MVSELSIGYGGKRYLSGYHHLQDGGAVGAHFGEAWPAVCAAKSKFDPHGIFNPGFIQYE